MLLTVYLMIWLLLAVYGLHRIWLISRFLQARKRAQVSAPKPARIPSVLIQLPLFNERYVAERLIRAVAALDYPRDRFRIQVLDDSTDDTTALVAQLVSELEAEGLQIEHIRRTDRRGYKAGALAHGLELDDSELVAVFDADFIPQPDFLRRTVGFFDDRTLGMVQTRWEHLNRNYSLLTQCQAILLDGHFVVEQTARCATGRYFNFNGTAGIWRRRAIDESGGWQHDTLTEDLDLSYRAQMQGWRFLYLDRTATPSEVPVDILGYKSQQHRWTKGAIQCARKLLPQLWRSSAPLRCKTEAGFHLLGNFCYPLILGLACLLGPLSLGYEPDYWQRLYWVIPPLLSATTLAVIAFYVVAMRAIGRGWGEAARLVPLSLSLSIGMAINNTWAIFEGLTQKGGEFVRTPKYRIEERRDPWRNKGYRQIRSRFLPWLELAMFLYFAGIGLACLALGHWPPIIFLAMFTFGFGYVAGLTWWGRWIDALATRPAGSRSLRFKAATDKA